MTTYRKSMSQALNEVFLSEDNMDLLKKAAGGAMQTLKMKDGKVKMDSFTASAIMGVYKAINPKNKKTMENVVNTGTISALQKLQALAMRAIKSGDEVEHDGEKLDEGKMSDLHLLIKQGKSAEEIAKIMKVDVKTIKTLMDEGARADAKRAMRKDKEVDPADVDDIATDDDVKAASKNIIMQMRKVISLRGNFKVEFGDKKKMKIDPKIAAAVQDKYNSMRKADDKEKFQAKVAKSYKDMLSALKESLNEVFDFVLLDKDNKIVGRYSGSNAKKAAESGKKSAHMPPMSIPKNEIVKMKIIPISPKDKKDIGDTVLAIGEAGWTDRKDPMPAGKELAKLMKKKGKKKKESTILDRIDQKVQEKKNG